MLIANYRPPIDKFCLEFPAGIIDPGETPEQSALRELKEETGYSASKIIKEIPQVQLYTDPWKSQSHNAMFMVEIDGTTPENQNPKQSLETNEAITVYLLDLEIENSEILLCSQIKALAEKHGFAITSSVWLFALGHDMKKMQQKL